MVNDTYLRADVELAGMEASIGAMLQQRVATFGTKVVYRERQAGGDYAGITWNELHSRVRQVGTALLARGILQGDRVAVYCPNCLEMLVWELAVMSIGGVSVPIFARYARAMLDYLLAHSGARWILVPDDQQVDAVLGSADQRQIEGIVRVRGQRRYTGEVPVVTWSDLLEEGSRGDQGAFDAAAADVGPDDPCFIMYTSGTTGRPKGVVLANRNIVSQQAALAQRWDLGPDDVFLSYLPWHHSFGGLFERFSALSSGATLCLDDSFGRDIPRLLANWAAIGPTVFFSVPKIFQALVTEARLSPEVDALLFHHGLKFVFTAAAPLPADCSNYFAAKAVPVLEGWGLTETSPCVTLTSAREVRAPSVVGRPLPGVEVMVTSEREILVRGPNVMIGYHRDPERTERAIDSSGWLHTGDLGEITPQGLRIICRIDGLFKLTNGEKVPCTVVENALTATSRYIEQAVALGAGKDFVAALLFPNWRNLESWARSAGQPVRAPEALVADPAVRALFAAEVDRQNELLPARYLRVKAFTIVPAELALDREELTPSLKIVRQRVLDRYEAMVKAIYREEDSAPELEERVVRLAAVV